MILAGGPKEWARLGIEPTESDIQRAVFQHLRERKTPGSVWFHVPNDRKSRRHAGFLPGVSDIIAVANGEAFALELKKASGGVVSEEQRAFISDWNEAGGFGCVAEGYDQALRILKEWGLIR